MRRNLGAELRVLLRQLQVREVLLQNHVLALEFLGNAIQLRDLHGAGSVRQVRRTWTNEQMYLKFDSIRMDKQYIY